MLIISDLFWIGALDMALQILRQESAPALRVTSEPTVEMWYVRFFGECVLFHPNILPIGLCLKCPRFFAHEI